MPDTLARLTASPVEHAGQRVITLGMMDEAHERPAGTARKAFNRHKDKLVEGEDFFRASEKWTLGAAGRMAGREPEVLLTESGYLLLVKSFHDALAWRVQRDLVRGYFRARDALSFDARAEQRIYALEGLVLTLARQHDKLVSLLSAQARESLRERRAARARLGFGQSKRRGNPDGTLPLKVVR